MTQTPMDIAVAFGATREGWSSTPYQDTAGVWTIGYGTTRINGKPVTGDTAPCTQAEGDAWLAADMGGAWASVQHGVTVAATAHQLAALIDFAYNVGINGFLRSTLLARFNAGQTDGAVAEFLEWVYDHDPATGQLVKVTGLVNRRNAEIALFQTPDAAPTAPAALDTSSPRSDAVRALQAALLAVGCSPHGVDGWFGTGTKAAVTLFQIRRGFPPTGIADTATQAALGLISKETS